MAKCKNCKYLDTVQNDLRSEPFKWCVCTDDSPVLDMERDCDYYAPMTNADRIRSMSDEELLDFICSIETYDDGSVKTIEGGYALCSVTDVEKWLQSEVEE